MHTSTALLGSVAFCLALIIMRAISILTRERQHDDVD